MKHIAKNGEGLQSDLSKRLADNVLESLVDYVVAPSQPAAEMLNAYSRALSALAVLAVAEQLQQMVAILSEAAGDEEDARLEGMWP